MKPFSTRISYSLFFGFFLIALSLAFPLTWAAAQTETPTATATRTPAPTPAPTATLTELQNRLLLADAYLKGGQFDQAAAMFSDILSQERGHPEALAGLNKALQGQVAAAATAVAPQPTPLPLPSPVAPAPSFSAMLQGQMAEVIGTVLPFLFVVVALYVLSQALRWVMFAVRELFYLRVLPFFRRPARARPFLIGEFVDATGIQGHPYGRWVTQRITEKLLIWNQLVQAKEIPIEPAPVLDFGGMSWIRVLWNWLLPPPRAFKIDGVLSGDQPGAFRLSVRRTDLSTNSVDASQTFESAKAVAEAAFQEMAEAAAIWLTHPRDIEAGAFAMTGLRSVRGLESAALSASDTFAEAVNLLLPVRQQVNMGAVDYADARQRLNDATALLSNFPEGSSLHADLTAVIADLHRAVPAA